jgi:Uma2 family endonuclease
MQEYQDNGCRLGWLIDPRSQQAETALGGFPDLKQVSKTVEIYRLGQPVEVLVAPQSLSGEAVLPGFVLNLETIFNSG